MAFSSPTAAEASLEALLGKYSGGVETLGKAEYEAFLRGIGAWGRGSHTGASAGQQG